MGVVSNQSSKFTVSRPRPTPKVFRRRGHLYQKNCDSLFWFKNPEPSRNVSNLNHATLKKLADRRFNSTLGRPLPKLPEIDTRGPPSSKKLKLHQFCTQLSIQPHQVYSERAKLCKLSIYSDLIIILEEQQCLKKTLKAHLNTIKLKQQVLTQNLNILVTYKYHFAKCRLALSRPSLHQNQSNFYSNWWSVRSRWRSSG